MATVNPPSAPASRLDTGQGVSDSAPSRVETAFNIAVWTLFTAFWVAFFAALLISQGRLDDIWHWVRDLSLVFQGAAWLLFLPWMVGLAIWESTWPVLVRIVLVLGLAWANIYLFFPRKR